MKRRSHKGLISAVVATAFASLWAAPVTCDQARTAVGNWLRADPGLGCRLGQSIDSARTCTTTNGANFHVVRLAGGGFVVTSADTTQEPVVAFSDSDDLVESADNPLWGILQADFSRRTRATNAVSRAVSAPSAAEDKWAALLSNASVARGGNGIASVSDLRVGEILKSKWGQQESSAYVDEDGDSYGYYCYNKCTPNAYPCGCVATAMGQIMRYYRYPDSANVVTRQCSVDGVSYNYQTSGKTYKWDNMPLVPEDYPNAPWYAGGTSSDEECEAIGWLTYDCGVAVHMEWRPTESGSKGSFAFEAFTNVFKYANARGYMITGNGTMELSVLRQIMLPNLDAGYPVMLGVAGHEVVADGYGYSSGALYTHLNLGWDGFGNVWYNLPNIVVERGEDKDGNILYYSSTIVNHITYNIFTNETGELLSGRIVDADGNPIENVLVSVSIASTSSSSGGNELARTFTNDKGIYAFRLQGGRTYLVRASYGAATQTLSAIPLGRSVNPSSVDYQSGNYSIGGMSYGNSWGNDLVFNGLASVAMPEFNPPSCLFHPTTNVTIACATSGATIRYTLDGSDPDATAPEFWASAPIVVTADTTIKARAFKDGLNPSAIVTATYTYDISQDAPIGDYYADPIVISGTEGTYTVPDNSNYTIETGEPYHSNYYQYHSIWYSWTAPGSGTMTFNGYAAAGGSIYPSIMAVYVGETMATAERIAFSADYQSNSDYSTSVSFTAEQGVTYHIVNAVIGETWLAPVRVSWSGDLTATPDPSVPTGPRTFYVNAAVPATSQQDGLTPTTAFHDLPAAMAILRDGDTVLVAPGTYSPAVVTASNVTIRATGAVAETIIDGGGTNACCSVDLEKDSASGAFEGFTLVNGGGVNFANENGVRYCRGGGALFVTLTRCVISNCVAEVGGGAHGCDLRNCLIACNMADYFAGGASECVLVGCTVVGNSAEEYCGGIDCDSVATNCIVWGNAVDDGSSPDFEASSYGAAQLAYCCSSSLAAGDGNLAADPKFCNAAAGDFRLRPVSPCLDAATRTDISSTETDLSGSPRIQGGAPDIGAFEGAFAMPAIRLLSDGVLRYSARAQLGELVFDCDTDWTVQCDAEWMAFGATFGVGCDAPLAFELRANDTTSARRANVTIVDGTGNAVVVAVEQAAAATPPGESNRYHGLFVGVDGYDKSAWRNLGFTPGTLTGSKNDAVSMGARFTEQGFCRSENALLLTDSKATVSAVRTAITNVAAQAVAGDTVLFYQSSHGYLSSGTTVALCEHNGFYWDYDLAADLELFADGVRVIVMADTCNSGGLFKGAGDKTRRTFNLSERVRKIMSENRLRRAKTSAAARNLSSPADIGWITAADYDQSAWDSGEYGNFTHACLEGWRTGAADIDGDGLINFYEMFLYAKDAGAADAAVYGEETEGQCFNELLLLATLAGKTDAFVSRDMSFAQVEVDCRDVTYNGSAIEPQITSVSINGNRLSRDTDFDVVYSDNVNAGRATITLVGIGSFTGTYTTNFVITKAANSWITQPSITGWTYGQAASAPNMGEAKFGTASVTYGALGSARPTEPGEYVAVFAVAETANWSGLTKEVPFTITAAKETMPPWPTDGAYNPLVANVYDGYILDANGALAGIIQVKAAKQAVKTVTDKVTKVKTATTNVAVTATVTDAAGKKWSYKGDGTVDGVATGLVCTTKGALVPSFGVTLGANGLSGEWGNFAVEGARSGMGTKGDTMMAALDANYKKSWSVTLTNELGATRLQLVVGAKGSTKISGVTPDGYKISATVQGIMGEDAFFVPYLATLKNGKLTRPANLLLTLGKDGTVVARTSDLGGLKAAGPTTDEIAVQPYAESESSKGGEAYAGAVVLNELAYPAKFAAKGLPAGLKIDAATGAITGIPTKPGRYTATITVTSGVNGKKKVETKVDFEIGNYTDETIDVEDSYSGYCVGVMVCEQIAGTLDCAVSGLPAGLKFAAKETKDKTFGTVTAGTVYGVPTKAGEYTVYFKKTEKVNGKSVTRQASATFKVEALPEWAQGTFDGHAGRVTLPEGEEGGGMVTLTVDAKGKISGKLIDADGTWTLSATAYERVEGLELEGLDDLGDIGNQGNLNNLVFHATVIGKNGKLATTNEVTVASEEVAAAVAGQPPYQRGVVSGWAASEPPAAAAGDSRLPEWTAWQNLWKQEPWKTDAKEFAKAPKLVIDAGTRDACPYQGTIELKFGASGAVTASGKFVTGQDAKGKDIVYSTSCSAVLVPDAARSASAPYQVFLYFPPKAGKFDGYGTEILFVWDGGKKEFLLAEWCG